MTEIKIGDTVLYEGRERENPIAYLAGHEGVVVGIRDADRVYADAEIKWSAPLPIYNDPWGEKDGEEITWTQYLPTDTLTLVKSKPDYDQDTVNAIVKHFKGSGLYSTADAIERKFAVSQTRTVSVNFQVPEGKSVVDYLGSIAIDYDIEGGN